MQRNTRILVVGAIATALTLSGMAAHSQSALKPLESKDPLMGYFFARTSTEDKAALGGFAQSSNSPRPITESLNAGAEITLRVDRAKAVPFYPEHRGMTPEPESHNAEVESYQGFSVFLINGTEKPYDLLGQDSRLSIIREAKDKDGKWSAIEYIPATFCGNSYHTITLASGHYWFFRAPVYSGPYKTQMRFRLGDLYSNEFSGSIYESQFRVPENPR